MTVDEGTCHAAGMQKNSVELVPFVKELKLNRVWPRQWAGTENQQEGHVDGRRVGELLSLTSDRLDSPARYPRDIHGEVPSRRPKRGSRAGERCQFGRDSHLGS